MALHQRKLWRALAVLLLIGTVAIVSVYPIFSAESGYSTSYASGIFYRRLRNVTLTGNPRTDIVNIAMSQIGYAEGDSPDALSGCSNGSKNYTEYGLWYNNQQEQPGGFEKAMWCATFLSWCADQANISGDTIYRHAYTVYGLNWFQTNSDVYTRQ